MTTRMRSVVPLLDGGAQRRIIAVANETSAGMAQALDWPGVLLEAGRNDVAEVNDLTLAHHYVGLNADPMPITLEVKRAHGYRAVTLAPGAGWVAPAGEPFSLRVAQLAIGVPLGLMLGIGAAGMARAVLFGVQPTDPATVGIVIALLAATGFAACVVPALRASRADPLRSLRAE